MRRFKEGSARASLHWVGRSGVTEARYLGPTDPAAFACLRERVLESSLGTFAYVARLDTALLLMGSDPPAYANACGNMAPAALIVRHDPVQYALWTAYARECAKHGMVRTVWTERFAALAYQWAAIRAAGSPPGELH